MGRRYRFKTDVASEAAGVAGNVAAAGVLTCGDLYYSGSNHRLGPTGG